MIGNWLANFVEYLYFASNLTLFLILITIMFFCSIVALFLIKWFMPLHFRYQENVVISSTCNLIIVVYGVLAGFATLNLINNEGVATDVMQREADAVANIYRDSFGLQEPLQKQVQMSIKNYANEYLNVEWPQMNNDETVKSNCDVYIRNITILLSHYQQTIQGETLIIQDMMTRLSNLYDARQGRIQASYASLSATIWIVIMIGTLLTLLIGYIFGVHFYLHIFIVIATALMTASVLFLLIGLDKPFVGEAGVTPDAMRNVLMMMGVK